MKSLASLTSRSLHALSAILFCFLNYRCKLADSITSHRPPKTEVKPMFHSVSVGRASSPVIQDGARGKAKLEENDFEEARSKRSRGMVLFQRHYQGT